MDKNDAKYYNEQINLFEENSEDLTTLSKQWLHTLKYSLGTVNTLTNVEFSEKSIREGILKVKESGKTLRVNNAKNRVQCNFDMLINSTVNSQKGIGQPQIISPRNLVVGSLDWNYSCFSLRDYLTFLSEQGLNSFDI